MRPLRIALLAGDSDDLARELGALGDDVRVIAGHGLDVVERRLARRGYDSGLSRWPSTYLRLHAARPDLVHAFDPLAAMIGARWARAAGRPAVLTLVSEVNRRWLLERRLRLRATVSSASECSAVLVADSSGADSLERALGITPLVIDATSGPAHHELYERLIGQVARP